MLQNIEVIAAHGQKMQIGLLHSVPKSSSRTGSIKFDMEPPADIVEKATVLRVMLGTEKFVWIAAVRMVVRKKLF